MAKGAPDYYNVIDIKLQTIAELTNRPKYGGAQRSAAEKVVSASAETDLVSVSGKGMIYGAIISLDHSSTQKLGTPRLYIDGNKMSDWNFFTLNSFNVVAPYGSAFFLVAYDDVNFIYVALTGYGYTFETSFKLSYFENNGGTPSVRGRAIYALV